MIGVTCYVTPVCEIDELSKAIVFSWFFFSISCVTRDSLYLATEVQCLLCALNRRYQAPCPNTSSAASYHRLCNVAARWCICVDKKKCNINLCVYQHFANTEGFTDKIPVGVLTSPHQVHGMALCGLVRCLITFIKSADFQLSTCSS